jgi:glycosyltransferase involved in cell wall biosynthesis
MKIGFFHYLYDYRGSRVQVGECVAALRDLGHEVVVADMDPLPPGARSGLGSLKSVLKRRLARYLHEPNALLKNLPAFVREWRILRNERPAFVIVRHKLFRFSSLLAAKWAKRPVILWVHGPGAYTHRRFEPRFVHYPFLAELVERFTWRLADAIVVVSEELKALLVAGGAPAGRIVVIPNGVDVGRFTPSRNGLSVRERYGLRDRVVIGFSGTLAPWHGIDHLSGVIRQLLPRYRQAALLIVGDGKPTARLVEEAGSAGVADRVIVTGHVAHTAMPEHLAAMDIAIAPYSADVPFYHSPLKLFEYLAMGKPVVAARIGQIAEVIEEDRSGLLYDPADGRQLVDQLTRLIEQPELQRRMGATARQAADRYTWTSTARSVVTLGEHLLQRRTPTQREAPARPLTLWVFLPTLAGGGAERVACRLLQGLSREAFRPRLLLLNATGEYRSDVPADVEIIDLHKRSRWDFFRILLVLRRLIQREQPDIIFSLMDYTNILSVLAGLGLRHRCRIVISQHNHHRSYLSQTRLPGLRKRLMAFTYRRADAVVVVSRGLAEAVAEDFNVPLGRIPIVHNPIDIERIQMLSRQPISHPFFERPANGFVIVTAGRLTRQKNVALLIRALALARRRIPASLIVLGQGELEGALRALAAELGLSQAVEFVGFQDNPFAWMRRADAFVLSSSWEGFGIVLAEAMACGAPVIATDCPAGPNEIIEHRQTGLLVPPEDDVALSNAIVELALDRTLRGRLVRQASASVERFDVRHVVERYERLFHDVTEMAPGRKGR